MLTLLFVVLLLAVILNVLKIAFKLAWGITKIAFAVVLFPLVLVAMAVAGFVYVAIAILIIVGIISFFGSLVLN